MSSKTKIFVFHMREVILTIIILVLFLLCAVFFVLTLSPGNKASSHLVENRENSSIQEQDDALETSLLANDDVSCAASVYVPGIYRTVLYLNDQEISLEVTVDEFNITSLTLLSINDNLNTLYPLLSPTFENIKSQLYEYQDLQLVTYEPENKYTSLVLLEAISKALEKAALP